MVFVPHEVVDIWTHRKKREEEILGGKWGKEAYGGPRLLFVNVKNI